MSSCFIYNDESAAYASANGFATALTPGLPAVSGGDEAAASAAGGLNDGGPSYALAPSLLASGGPASAYGAYANSCWAAAAANHPAAKYRKFAATFAWPTPQAPHMGHHEAAGQMLHSGGLDVGAFGTAFPSTPAMCGGIEAAQGASECGQLSGSRSGGTPNSGASGAGQPVWPWMTVVGECGVECAWRQFQKFEKRK